MPTECAESGCPNKTDSGICKECSAEMKYGTTSRAYDADGNRVELRAGETKDDDNTHTGDIVARQLAEADDEDLESIGVDADDMPPALETDGQVVDHAGTPVPPKYDGVDLQNEGCPVCGGSTFREERAGYYDCDGCLNVWAGDPEDASIACYVGEPDENEREIRTDGGQSSSGTERRKKASRILVSVHSGSDHSCPQSPHWKSAVATPSTTYFVSCSPNPFSHSGQQAFIPNTASDEIWLNAIPNCIGIQNDDRSSGASRLLQPDKDQYTIRNFPLPHEHASRPIGRTLPSLRIRAAYADSQFLQVTSIRLLSVRVITRLSHTRIYIFKPYIDDLEIHSAVIIKHKWSLHTDTDRSEGHQ